MILKTICWREFLAASILYLVLITAGVATSMLWQEIYVHSSIYGTSATVDSELLCGKGAVSLQLQHYFVYPTAVRTPMVAGDAWNMHAALWRSLVLTVELQSYSFNNPAGQLHIRSSCSLHRRTCICPSIVCLLIPHFKNCGNFMPSEGTAPEFDAGSTL